MELTLKEAADIFGRGYCGLYAALRSGRITGRKSGGTWLVKTSEIEAALRDGRLQAGPGYPKGRRRVPRDRQETTEGRRALDAWTEETLRKEEERGNGED